MPNLNYGVDHYRPKGPARFAGLACDYSNLYYCCGICNSRKNDYWPANETSDPWIVNPCEHQMSNHLRFDARSGCVDYRTVHGEFTRELLELNDEARLSYRQSTLRALARIERDHQDLAKSQAAIDRQLRRGEIDAATHHALTAEVARDLADVMRDAQMLTGEGPARPLPMRAGKVLHTVK